MRFDLATLSLLGALQALLLAPLLLVATRAYTGRARTSLRIWGMVLVLQSLGWLLAALRGQISDWWSIVLANGVLIVSYAETARALRLLLEVPQRRGWLAAIGLAAWLGIAWFGVVQPDYRTRVCIAAAMLGCYLGMLLWPLRHALRRGGSTAQRVMLLVLAGAAVAWGLRLHELATLPQVGLLLPTPGNIANMVYGTLEPVFATLGFLLMYNEAAQAELRRLARTDPLTGTFNRLALDEEGLRMFDAGEGLAALMLDADHFKTINDRFGHAVGDEVLRRFAAIIRSNIRASDTAARLGGEEFCLILRGLDPAAAHAAAERIRAALEATPALAPNYGPPTVSAGIAIGSVLGDSFDRLLREADERLYGAKDGGRNRVHGPSRRLAA